MRQEFITPKIISKKCRYALRAVFELACRSRVEVTKINDIAAAQNIPPRFLENILVELKQAGFVTSVRGKEGGYLLEKEAEKLTVGNVIEFIQGAAKENFLSTKRKTFGNGDFAFSQLWRRLNKAISDIYEHTTFADLIQEESKAAREYIPNYVI